MVAKKGSCRFCQIIENPFAFGDARFFDIPIYEDENFLVLPALGPLVDGHIMVISRVHRNSMLELGSETLEKLDRLCAFLEKRDVNATCCIFEHGSGRNGGGPCISHAHLHVLPAYDAKQLGRLIGHPLTRVSRLGELEPNGSSYYLVRSSEGWNLYADQGEGSQTLRKLVRRNQGRSDWDWRLTPHYEQVRASIGYWSQFLNVSED